MKWLRTHYPILLLLALWEGVSQAGLISPQHLPPFSQCLLFLFELTRSGEILVHIRDSIIRAMGGYFLSLLVGIPVGITMGLFRSVERPLGPVVALFYPIPKVTLIPLLILWLGLGDRTKIAIVFLACLLPVLISSRSGARNVDVRQIWAARTMGTKDRQLLRLVILPSALPYIFSGMRISLAISFILLFSTEMLGAQSGLGYLIIVALEAVRPEMMFAGVLVIGVVAYTCDRMLLLIRKRMLFWQTEQSAF
jgi:ABC-type nitrate/sulfonate/bicarbonate transport system permease component